MEELRAKKIKGPDGLREEAKKCGIKYASKMSKEEMISLINSSKYVKHGEEHFDKKELIEIANEAGVAVGNKSKQRLISEIRFTKNDTANRTLFEPSFYEDKSDEELVKDLFMQGGKDFRSYSLKYGFGYIPCTQCRKVVNMEKFFVRLRAGSDEKVIGANNDDRERKRVNGELFYITDDPNSDGEIKPVKEVLELVEKTSHIVLLDDGEDWNKESLYSLALLLGCSMSKINKRASNHNLLSLLITLEANTFLAMVLGEENVTRLDLRKRFYQACWNLSKESFFINASRAKNSEKGKRLAKQMEERDMYFERGIGWVSKYDDY